MIGVLSFKKKLWRYFGMNADIDAYAKAERIIQLTTNICNTSNCLGPNLLGLPMSSQYTGSLSFS